MNLYNYYYKRLLNNKLCQYLMVTRLISLLIQIVVVGSIPINCVCLTGKMNK